MPIIAGQPFYDASGNAMTDANGDPIGEPDLPVALQMGVLTLAGSNPLEDLLDTLSNVWEAIQDLTTGALEMQAIRNLQDDMNAFLENGGPDTFTGHDPLLHPSLITAEGIINSIGTPTIEWPTEPPEWYTAPTEPDLSGIPSDVWAEVLPMPHLKGSPTEMQAGLMLREAALAGTLLAGYVGIPVPDRPYWEYLQSTALYTTSDLGYWTNTNPTEAVPLLDLSLVQAGDTVWSYLNREYAEYTFLQAGPGNWPTGGHVYIDWGAGAGYFRCTLTDADIRTAVTNVTIEGSGLEVNVDTAPVWPGSANVTLGTPVELVDQLYLQEAMDGVIIAVTTPPTRTGLRQIGGALYDYGVGEMAFETDAGDLEPWQYLGFRAAIFTPKSMKQAAGARFRVLAGASGTVTPWTRS